MFETEIFIDWNSTGFIERSLDRLFVSREKFNFKVFQQNISLDKIKSFGLICLAAIAALYVTLMFRLLFLLQLQKQRCSELQCIELNA